MNGGREGGGSGTQGFVRKKMACKSFLVHKIDFYFLLPGPGEGGGGGIPPFNCPIQAQPWAGRGGDRDRGGIPSRNLCSYACLGSAGALMHRNVQRCRALKHAATVAT